MHLAFSSNAVISYNMIFGKLQDGSDRYQTNIDLIFYQHFRKLCRISADQFNMLLYRSSFETINKRLCIQVVDDTNTNLLQLSYFCGSKGKGTLLFFKIKSWN